MGGTRLAMPFSRTSPFRLRLPQNWGHGGDPLSPKQFMLTITPHAEQMKPDIDAVIFDMDGVMLDITGTIRVVNCLAVPFFLREILGMARQR